MTTTMFLSSRSLSIVAPRRTILNRTAAQRSAFITTKPAQQQHQRELLLLQQQVRGQASSAAVAIHHHHSSISRGNVIRNSSSAIPIISSGHSSITQQLLKQHGQSPIAASGASSTTRALHSKGDQQFLEFLKEEIQAEKNDAASEDMPSVTGFETSSEGADVTLTKTLEDETLTVEFSVNSSVKTLDTADIQDDGIPPPEMISQPPFSITIAKKGQPNKLSLLCEFVHPDEVNHEEGEDQDVFEITEVTIHSGEWEDNTYHVSADILDANMYDMLMLMLEERGITHKQFADELIEFSTAFEHKKFISLLEGLRDFIKA